MRSIPGRRSDPEAGIKIRLEYARQLELLTRKSADLALETMRTHSAEYDASNHSNKSIAGRSQVLAPFVISSRCQIHGEDAWQFPFAR